jgi:hypothetical protein
MLGGSFSEIAATANVAFLLAFPSLFSIINPIGGALIFSVYTRAFAQQDRRKTAGLVGLYSLAVMFCALWGGAYVLNFFGVSIDAVRIAGGFVVALSGWHLLNSGDQHPDRKTGDNQPATGQADDDPKQVAFFPAHPPLHHWTRHDRGGDHAWRGATPGERSCARLLPRRNGGRDRQCGDHLDRLPLRRPADGSHGRDGAAGRRAPVRIPADVHRRADSRHRDRRFGHEVAGALARSS